MADSISIVRKMQEDITGTMKSIASASKGVSKEFEDLRRKTEALGTRYADLNKKAAQTSVEAVSVKRSMNEAAKAFNKTGAEADRVSLEKLREEYQALTDSAKGYTVAAKDTQKAMNENFQAMRKLGDTTGSTGGAGSIGGLGQSGGTPAALAKAGGIKMLGDAASQWSETLVSSAFGSDAGTLFSSALSGAGSGATIGSTFGPVGTAVGAVIGGGVGLLTGGAQIYEKRDEAFKDYYKNLYDTGTARTADDLATGKALAARRETNRLAFANELGEEKADEFLADVLETSNITPFLYDDLVGLSKTLLSFGTAVDDIIPMLTKIGDAGAAKGLAAGDINTVAAYLGRMQSSNRATREDLDSLSDRGFSVYQWLAEDQGISIDKVNDKISKEELSGTYVSDLILEKFQTLYGGMMGVQSKSTESLDSTLQGLTENIQAAKGDAYNESRNYSKERDIAVYGGSLGDKLSELNAISGRVEAFSDNQRDLYQREALSAVLEGKSTSAFNQEDQKKLEELRAQFETAEAAWDNGDLLAGQTMTDLKEEAEALATASFESSGWSQKLHEAELDQITAIRDLTASMDAATNAWETSDAFTKGQASTRDINGFESTEAAIVATGGDVGVLEAQGVYSNAYGLGYVPYNGYPAILHQGERVLTAAEARERDRGGGAQVLITGNTFQVRSDADIPAIAAALADEIEARDLAYGGA